MPSSKNGTKTCVNDLKTTLKRTKLDLRVTKIWFFIMKIHLYIYVCEYPNLKQKKKKKRNSNLLDLKKETVVALTKAQASKVVGGGNPINPDTLAQTSVSTSGGGGLP